MTALASPAGANNSSHISHSTSSASSTTRCRTRSKVNPAFLAGDQLLHLASTRPGFEVLEPLAASAWGVVAAWGSVVTEAWLAIGLWLRRTRVVTAVLGAVVHVVLVAAASRGLGGVVSLTVLNGLLVVGYLASFDRGEAERGGVAPEGRTGRWWSSAGAFGEWRIC